MKPINDSNIEDLARLAREGCAYRGSSQQADAPLPRDKIEQGSYSQRPLQKLVAAFRR